MSIEVARFLDNTEYSTNAMINFPRKLYRHPSLRESALACRLRRFGGSWCKITKKHWRYKAILED